MVNNINSINRNNIVQMQGVAQQNKQETAASNVATNNTEAVYPSYMPVSVKKPQKLGEIKVPYADNAQVYQLANGQKLITLKKKGPTTLNTFVKVGSFNETDNIRGISHYIEHNLFNGSSQLKPNEFVEKVSDMGGTYNAGTGFMCTNYFITSPLHNKNDLNEMLKAHADMLETPTFSNEMLEKEKGIVCSEIQMMEDRPNSIAQNQILSTLFNIETDSTDLIGGTVNNIQNLNKKTVTDYYNKYYTPDNMTTVVVGDINPDEIANKLNTLFISRRPTGENKVHEKLTPIEKTVRKDISNPQVKSTSINMGFAGPKNNDIEGIVATDALFEALLGTKTSRLEQDLDKFNTDADMLYDTISNNPEDPVIINLYSSFKNGDEEKGLKQIYETLHKMTYDPVSDKELENIKSRLKNRHKRTSESSMALSMQLGGMNLVNDLGDINKSFEMIDKLSAKDIQNAAKNFLDLNKAAIIVTHPQKKNTTDNVNFSGHSEKKFHSDAIEKLGYENVESYKLKNNMAVDYQHLDSPFAYSKILIHNDNYKETKPEVSLVLANMLNMGSAYQSDKEFYQKADDKNIGISFSTGTQGLIAYTNSDKEDINESINMAKEVLFAPGFTQKNLDKVKEEIKLEYSKHRNNPVPEALAVLYPDNPKFTPLEKMVEKLDNITLDEVKKSYSNIINGAEAKTVVTAASTEKNKVLANLEKTPLSFDNFDYNFNPDQRILDKNVVLTKTVDQKQAAIVQLFKINQTGNVKDQAALLLMNKVLGGGSSSRLFMDLREEQKLAYSVRSSFVNNGEDARLQLSIETTTEDSNNGLKFYDNLQKSLDGFNKHIELIKNTPVSEKELNKAKLSLLSNEIYLSESARGKHHNITQQMESIYGKNYNKELRKALQEITSEDIQKVAKHYLSGNSVVSIVANQNTLDANKDYLSSIANS